MSDTTNVALEADEMIRLFDSSWVKLEECPPSPQYEKLKGVEGGFLLRHFLSEGECAQLIAASEKMEYTPSPLRNLSELNSKRANLSAQTQLIRFSDRVLCDAPEPLLELLCHRLLPHLPSTVECKGHVWEAVPTGESPSGGCINRRWRFNRYSKGGYFRPHRDAGFVYSSTCETLMTFIVYLSEGFEGGETTFFLGLEGQSLSVRPERGMAIVFFQTGRHSPVHEGSELRSEEPFKYILRSDLAYRVLDAPEQLNRPERACQIS